MYEGFSLFVFMYSFKSFRVGLSLLIEGKSDFFNMANLFDFEEP